MLQTEIVNLEDLVPSEHIYRRFSKLWSFQNASAILNKLESGNNYKGYGLLRLKPLQILKLRISSKMINCN